jgi:hypothetical protein
MALGAITEFEADNGILVNEDLSEFEPLIFEQCDEMALRHFGYG